MMKTVKILIAHLLIITAICDSTAQVPLAADGPEGMVYLESGYEYVPDVDYEGVEDRLNCLQSDIPLNFNETVYAFVQYFAIKDRDYTHMILRRQNVYFPIFEEILKKHELPEELKYLSIVESGLNPRAISRAGAVGLWQFMPYTGRYYGLHQDWYVDERMDPYKATEAASKYIKSLYRMFGDWELALAAYNSGPGNVRKAIRRSGYKKSFWEIYRYLPRETRSYVPQYVAIYYILNYAVEHNFVVDDPEYPMAFDTLVVNNFLNLNILCDQLNICIEDMEMLNPAIKNKALSKETRDFVLRIPADKKEYLIANRNMLLDSARGGQEQIEYKARNSIGSTWGRDKLVHTVGSGDVLGIIAQRYGVRISDIKRWNNLNSNLIRIGQRLNIWIYPGSKNNLTDDQPSAKSTSLPQSIPPSKVHVVQPGDTLWDISRMYRGLTIEKIKELNNLRDHKIKPGQKLIIG